MPPREPPAEVLDTDSPENGVAQAQARAEAARARAVQLRQLAEAASNDHGKQSDAQDGDRDDSVTLTEGEAETAPSRRWRPHRPSRRALALAAAGAVVCASLTASGYVVWRHHNVAQQRERSAEFATAARNAVTAMMSIDPSKARDDVQRFSDATTGVFKASILVSAEDFVRAVEESKVRIKGDVQIVAVESMTKDSAVVLVTAKSEITKPDQAKPESRSWRMVVNVERDGSQLKISKVEFVP